jgi:uncharacterized alpha-E superfamily protein
MNMARLLQAAVALERPANVLAAILEIADSSMTYRRRYLSQPQLGPALDLLLFDSGNPRSFAFQLETMTAHAAN